MPHLLIIRGLPGSGKSTLAKSLGRHHYEADMLMVNDNGDYFFQPELLKGAHEWCLEACRSSLDRGHDTVVSNTFTRRWEVMPYINLGYPFSVVVCEGNYGNIHGVPNEKIVQMRERWEWF